MLLSTRSRAEGDRSRARPKRRLLLSSALEWLAGEVKPPTGRRQSLRQKAASIAAPQVSADAAVRGDRRAGHRPRLLADASTPKACGSVDSLPLIPLRYQRKTVSRFVFGSGDREVKKWQLIASRSIGQDGHDAGRAGALAPDRRRRAGHRGSTRRPGASDRARHWTGLEPMPVGLP